MTEDAKELGGLWKLDMGLVPHKALGGTAVLMRHHLLLFGLWWGLVAGVTGSHPVSQSTAQG